MTPIQVSQASGQATIKQEPTDSTTQITVTNLFLSLTHHLISYCSIRQIPV